MTQPLDDAPPPKTPSKAARITGWILSAIPILMLGVMPIFMFFNMEKVLEGLKQHGYPESVAVPLLIVEILCGLLYAIPQTATLGAILIAAYLGGAVATHVQASEFHLVPVPIILAIIAWLGLLLRDPHLRRILPLRL